MKTRFDKLSLFERNLFSDKSSNSDTKTEKLAMDPVVVKGSSKSPASLSSTVRS
ncbi:MAG: hypothetical protein AB7O99_01890 [Dongiaceae bacterium]